MVVDGSPFRHGSTCQIFGHSMIKMCLVIGVVAPLQSIDKFDNYKTMKGISTMQYLGQYHCLSHLVLVLNVCPSLNG
jgi:hypothetical protein